MFICIELSGTATKSTLDQRNIIYQFKNKQIVSFIFDNKYKSRFNNNILLQLYSIFTIKYKKVTIDKDYYRCEKREIRLLH